MNVQTYVKWQDLQTTQVPTWALDYLGDLREFYKKNSKCGAQNFVNLYKVINTEAEDEWSIMYDQNLPPDVHEEVYSKLPMECAWFMEERGWIGYEKEYKDG